MTLERWAIAGLVLALAWTVVLYAGARSEANERWKATLQALALVRKCWAPLHILTSSPRLEDQRAGAVVSRALEQIDEVLLLHGLPEEDGVEGAPDSGPTALEERRGAVTRREGSASP